MADADGERAGRTVGQIEAEGGKASAFVADVTDADSCAAMVDAAVERYGRLDILHNNVGIGGAGNVVEVDPEVWDTVMTVNVKSMMLTSKYAIPVMAAGGGGSIINISSISAIRPRGLTAYTASKGRGDGADAGDGGRSRQGRGSGETASCRGRCIRLWWRRECRTSGGRRGGRLLRWAARGRRGTSRGRRSI